MNARTQAIARMNADQDASQQRAIAAAAAERARPKNALEAMSMRLQVSPAGLKDTLLNTVFKGCRNDSEFIALTIVSNEYGLNPLTKEIYAFPAKGGGIVPMVSVDGWIRIMNSHPEFDGIEFENIVNQKGEVEAIEAVIHRKDRARPIRVIEYLDECKRNTEPWNMMPKRMLRNKALIQGARIAFGFSGIYSEDDPELEYRNVTPQRMPSAEEFNQQQVIDHNTGEVTDNPALKKLDPSKFDAEGFPKDEQTGFTEIDEDTARHLDAEQTYQDLDGPIDEGTEFEQQAEDPKRAKLAEIEQMLVNAETLADVKKADAEWVKHRAVYDDSTVKTMDELIYRRKQRASEGPVGK